MEGEIEIVIKVAWGKFGIALNSFLGIDLIEIK